MPTCFQLSYFFFSKYFPGKIYEDYPKHSPSDGEFYTEECPVYDNLNHCHPEMLNESCYEQMNAQPHPSASDVQVVEHQMCYASLDHSVKRKQKRNKKKYPTLGMDEDHLPGSNPISSDTCIYLNSEQLSAENKLTDNTIHEDPFGVFGFIHTTNDDRFQ
ncbi:T-cell receptor-associated transmembrane adapter 1-like [Sceloporus undulatus]|uniref:T-cell receptor-associated transmembrane adapter 1-like n=1 Tax=Sceloporus undulatus TaxID=8520 RepID=UPI001C4CADB4|nr:T-cell receptor-associated transmembrane adapter 1-like [Sceloporus undulatus]